MSKETDKKLADLYLARSEGRIIQEPAVSIKDGPCWIELEEDCTIGAQCRIRPQTLEEAAEEAFKDFERAKMPQDCRDKMFFRLGAEWRDENPEVQE